MDNPLNFPTAKSLLTVVRTGSRAQHLDYSGSGKEEFERHAKEDAQNI